eukprot:1405398-Pleurochrysis_carterae.AAC.1
MKIRTSTGNGKLAGRAAATQRPTAACAALTAYGHIASPYVSTFALLPEQMTGTARGSVTAVLLHKEKGSVSQEQELFHACVRKDTHAVAKMLQEGVDPNFKDAYGCSCLFVAARNGYVRICRALLVSRADVNAPTHTGDTPLKAAVRKLHPEIVQTLMQAGAKIDQPDKWGRYPIDEIVCGGPASTQAEDEIRAMLTHGLQNASVMTKLEQVESMRAQHRQALEASRQQQVVEKARAQQLKQQALEEEEAERKRAAASRMRAQPHVWVESDAGPSLSLPCDSHLSGSSRDSTRATQARESQHKKQLAQKDAEWRSKYNPLLGRARPEVPPPTNSMAWDDECSEFKGKPLNGERESQIRSSSGFQRFIAHTEANEKAFRIDPSSTRNKPAHAAHGTQVLRHEDSST